MSSEIQIAPQYRAYNLDAGERLDRATCLLMCERLFRMDAECAGDELTGSQRDQLVATAKKMCYKLQPDHDTYIDPIETVVRSVPVRMYGEALRHYYLRIEDVLDVHPGTNHRLALAWWHNTTQQEQDTLERRMFLCGECFDAFVANVWSSSQRFNIVYNNCDQILNRCEQSTGLGLFFITLSSYLLFGDVIGACILLLVFAAYGLTCRYWYGSNAYAFRHPHYRTVYRCEHVEQLHADPRQAGAR